MTRRQPRRNKKKMRLRDYRLVASCLLGFKLLAAAAAVALVSCLFILIHDAATQSSMMPVVRITVEGHQRLSAQTIVRRAGVSKGDNILAVNLSKLRRRLISHPWIAEAQVRREIPGGIRIRVWEHQALAVVDLGDGFLLNTDGCLFKVWEPDADPPHLPTIRGLAVADLKVAGAPNAEARFSWPAMAEAAAEVKPAHEPMAAAMQVLNLGRDADGVIPNRLIKMIQVDPAMGLRLYAFDPPKTIGIGYDGYRQKYQMLARLLGNRRVPDFSRIDLQDLNRIVIKPAGANQRAAGS